MKIEVKATPKIEEALSKLELLGAGILPATARAIDASAGFVMRTWVNFAQGNDQSGKPDNVSFTGNVEYANSISIKTISPFHKQVFSDSEIGASLEEGREEYDMKPALVAGPKSRQADDGHRYNIIPFRHKIKELMKIRLGNNNAYMLAKSLVQQHTTGFKVDSEGKRRLAYAKWTSDKVFKGGGAKHLAGLVRMKTGAGGEKRSQYLTFRVVKLDQVGKWIRKAQDPWDIRSQVVEQTKDKIERLVHGALRRDLGLED